MTDRDNLAWRLPPSDYSKGRSARFTVPRPLSQYVLMRDGCRLAADIFLPRNGGADDVTPGPFPTIVIFTPYYRRFQLLPDSRAEPSPNTARYRDAFVPRGYALVVVDVRGTGASFGSRDSFRSPRERDDYWDVTDWIIAQPWSNGVVGSTGISYLGAASLFLASTGHPAVKAVAPLFAVWDNYIDQFNPGGMLCNGWLEPYDRVIAGLDQDQRDLLCSSAYFSNPDLDGPMPVDEDVDRGLLRQALAGHANNIRLRDFASEFSCRDDSLSYDNGIGPNTCSPNHYFAGIDSNVAIYSITGWMDGAGYSNSSISRFLTIPNGTHRLLIGPWDHGARINVSPWREKEVPEFDLLAPVVRFFDHHLMGLVTGLEKESLVHFFSFHDEAWHAADSWPIHDASVQLFLGAGRKLKPTRDKDEKNDEHDVVFATTTGTHTRYERLGLIDTRNYYDDWRARSTRHLDYITEPLSENIHLAGHAVLTLLVSCSEPDSAIFAYLTEIENDGKHHYVTEGMLRLLHRAEAPPPPEYRCDWPFRSFSRTDAAPFPSDTAESIRIPLLPVAWLFRRDSRIRLSLSGADASHFGQVPRGRPPRWAIGHGGANGSVLTLPLRTASHTNLRRS